ncbi:MAG: energy transducer TonB [Acidobacteriaceae bacterium]
MAKSVVEEFNETDRAPQRELTLGLLPEGRFNWRSFSVSAIINASVLALLILLTIASLKSKIVQQKMNMVLLAPVATPPPPPPPVIKAPPPEVLKQLAPPKIEIPKPIEAPQPKPIQVKMNTPVPVLPPAPPKAVTPPPAPKRVLLAEASPASVPNHEMVSRPVSLGDPNALRAQNNARPAAHAVSLGLAGMPATNNGQGERGATHISLGSGAPNGAMGGRDRGATRIVGLSNGVPGGTGDMHSRGRVANVALGQAVAPPAQRSQEHTGGNISEVVVTYKPPSAYTEEAKQLHIQGSVDLEVVFTARGTVQVLRVVHGLGHGLDESAIRSAEGIRFKPAMQNGHPIDRRTIVHIIFQLS